MMGVLYNSLNLTGQPSTITSQLPPCTQVYPASLWDNWGGGGTASDKELPPEEKVKAAAATWPTDRPAWLNIEHWQLGNAFRTVATEETLLANLGKMKQVVDWCHEANPSATLGVYGGPGCSVGSNFGYDNDGGATEQADWDRAVASGLVAALDFIICSMYTRYDDTYESSWGRRHHLVAVRMLTRGKAVNRPVYTFLWPRYHEAHATLGEQALPAAFVRKAVVFSLNVFDGAFLWSGHTGWTTADDEWWAAVQPAYQQHRTGAVA